MRTHRCSSQTTYNNIISSLFVIDNIHASLQLNSLSLTLDAPQLFFSSHDLNFKNTYILCKTLLCTCLHSYTMLEKFENVLPQR